MGIMGCGLEPDVTSVTQYAKPEKDLAVGEFRNLTVDNPAPMPQGFWVRLLAARTDVIHR